MNSSSSKKQRRKTVIMRKRIDERGANRRFKSPLLRVVHKHMKGGSENPIDIGSKRPPKK